MSAYKTLPLSRRPGRRVREWEIEGEGRAPRPAPASPGGGDPVGAPSAPKGQTGELTGYIHSVESFGTLDGPGIRYVIFFQGCHLRCLFCQNRDTWEQRSGRTTTVAEVMSEIRRYKRFMESSGGGITASGGDPILQPRFVTELFRAAREEGIHTALDTSGVTAITPAVDELLSVTDLVLLDIKHINSGIHWELTGHGNERVLALARHLDAIGKRTWVRHVVVPGYSATEESARETARFLAGLDAVEQVDLLPYHEFGSHKWEALAERYPLEGVEPPSKEQMEALRAIFLAEGAPVA